MVQGRQISAGEGTPPYARVLAVVGRQPSGRRGRLRRRKVPGGMNFPYELTVKGI